MYDRSVLDPTRGDVAKTLFLPFFAPAQPEDLQKKVDTLVTVVVDLLIEVEALRECLATGTKYREAYRKTGLCAHDSTGPSMGWDKVVALFYPADRDDDGRAWREALLLRRLGCTADEIASYRREALGMEVRT